MAFIDNNRDIQRMQDEHMRNTHREKIGYILHDGSMQAVYKKIKPSYADIAYGWGQ
ncbi:hypothetical protein N9K75_02835 [bacterium]|nr:hypothetical protein [bacterium]